MWHKSRSKNAYSYYVGVVELLPMYEKKLPTSIDGIRIRVEKALRRNVPLEDTWPIWFDLDEKDDKASENTQNLTEKHVENGIEDDNNNSYQNNDDHFKDTSGPPLA